MYLLPTILLLLLNRVASHPTPSPQAPGNPLGLQCPNGPTCQSMMTMSCANGNLYCSLGNMVNIPVGKCSECAGSICAKGSDAYPGDSTPKSTRPREHECACVSFNGKGYYTTGKGSQCPAMEGAQEYCAEETGFVCIFGCRSPLLSQFTNAKCHALFPGTRAVCRSL
ncbi:hypothetical protein V8F06_009333 [Rhypophila decipiens]